MKLRRDPKRIQREKTEMGLLEPDQNSDQDEKRSFVRKPPTSNGVMIVTSILQVLQHTNFQVLDH